MNQYIIIILATMLVALSACNDDLLLKVKEPDELIVVDGWIEYGKQAKVLLTSNSPYFTSIDSSSLIDLVLSAAKVTLSDGEQSEVLILRRDSNYFPPYSYSGNSIIGDTGKIYTLSAFYGGKSVTAQTTIPGAVDIDTTYFELIEDSDSLGNVVIRFTDPPDEKNYYRIFTKREGIDDRFISALVIAIDDQYFNGQEISFTLFRAPTSFLSAKGSDYYRLGDTIVMKLCTMDEESFKFWNTYQDEVINATNPFASSMIDLESNIEGDGLGVWGGYGVSLDTIK